MKANLKSFFALSLLLLFAISQCVSPIRASNIPAIEEKIYSDATIEDDFADDRIMVVLQNDVSLQFKTFSEEDFSEVDCVDVTDLSTGRRDSIQKRLQEVSVTAATNRDLLDPVLVQDMEKFHQVICLNLEQKSKANVLQAIKLLQQRDDVLYAGPDYVLEACATTPSDTNYADQWALPMISMPQAWDITTGSSTVRVGVVDNGIDTSHGELSGQVSTTLNRDYVSDGITSGTHATMIAGIIGAKTNNDFNHIYDIAGMCWDISMVSLRILDAENWGYSSAAAAAINYAESYNIPILNLSVGWYWDELGYDEPLNILINNYSGLVVCAAGNRGLNIDNVSFYPATFNHSNVITVGASTASDTVWTSSNYGATKVDLFAPGENIFSIKKGGGFGTDSGTSYAAPYVTGVAALLLSIHPELTAAELRQVIMENVDVKSAYSGKCVTGGRLNAYKALCDNSIHTYTSNASGHSCSGTRCDYWESHTYTATPYNASQHKLYCAQCSYTTYANHTYLIGGTMCTVCGYSSSGFEEMGVDEVLCVMA